MESFGGGCLTVLSALTHELHNDFRHTVIYSIRAETPTNIKELFGDRVKLRIRFSLNNLKLDGDVLNIPLFMADHSQRLIGLALEQRGK